MQKTSKRVLALVLALIMMLSVFSVSAAAYDKDYQSETHTVFKHTEQTLAPGVEYYNNYAYSSDGKQMVYYVATADISRDDVVVQTSYLNQYKDKQPGMSKLSEQVAFANQYYTDSENPLYLSDYYNVVAGTNASFYNMQTGQPTGVCYVDGTSFGNTSYPAFFAILQDEDGKQTAIMDDTANVGNYDNIWQAVGGQYWLVRDGVDVTADASGSYLTDRHSRTVVGITDDGKVVLMVLDGRQEPFSCGGTMHELAQIMLEAGCKYAMNIDGGGSTTFGARPEGEDSFKVINRPSDGSERSISSGLIIASLAEPSNVFDRVSMTVADEYVTPGTSTEITVAGVSTSGASADIPAEVTYEATNGTYADGVFTAGSTAGDAVITAKYNDNTVGTATVHVVVPDSIEFSQETFTVPYGKSSDIGVTAKYGLNEVLTKASDFTFTLEDQAAGVMDGFVFTAAAESEIASTVLTAVFNGTEMTSSTTLLFGKGSEVIFDFEDGTTNGFNLSYSNYNYYLPNSKAFVATRENGQVHSGDYALGLNIDYSNSQESGYMMTSLYQGKVSGNVNYYPGALKVGTWIYIPDEYVGLWVRWQITPITAIEENAETGEPSYTLGSTLSHQYMDNTAGGTGVVYSFDEPGWHYLWADLSQYKGFVWRDFYYNMQFYISDRDGASYGYYAKNNHNINGDFTVYIDDITVDYSTVVEDRDAPVFSGVLLGDRGPHSNDALTLTNGYDSDGYSQLSLSARVADYTATNATGINASSAKAYIDGNEVSCTFVNGLMAIDEWDFSEGQHSVKFVIYDNAGNRSSATRTFTVSNVANSETVKIVAHDPSLNRILHGSLYWVDVVAENADDISKIVTTLNLDSMSKWELDHMIVADGFKASYKVVDEGDKVVELTIEAEGEIALTGEQALVSIPIRSWEMDNKTKKGALNASKNWNYAEFKASNEFWQVAVEVRVQQGIVYDALGKTDFFTGDDVFCWTESWANNANMVSTQEGKDYKAAWNGGHDHRPEYAAYYADGTTNYVEPRVSKEAKDPTCTEDGWTAELYCDVCNSVVKWSEPIPATGHTFEIDAEDGLMKCVDCGELANEVIDGKLYVEGAPAQGFIDNKYYIDGVAQDYDGLVQIDGIYYEFDNGTSLGKFTGMFFDDEDGVYRYSQLGELSSGWKQVDGDWHYFREHTLAAAQGRYDMSYIFGSEVIYFFEEDGKVQSGVWSNDGTGTKYFYGPSFYRCSSTTSDATLIEIDGKTYAFDHNGYIYTGVHSYRESNADRVWYDFGEDGALIGTVSGLFTENGVTFYVEDGQGVYAGLIQIDGDYYYVRSNYHVATGNYYVYKTNGLLPEGYYDFDDDGKMIVEQPNNGIVDGIYYVDGVPTYAGLIQINGDYYYIRTGGYVATGHYWVHKTNDLMPYGYYDFDDDGKMIVEQPKNGIVDGMYYVDDVPTYAGLIQIDGDYYYIRTGGYVATGHYWVNKTNDLLPYGYYDFDDSGKMIIEQPKNGIVDGVYYVDDVATYAGLIEIDGDYYYIRSNGAVATGRYWVHKTNDLMPYGYYDFDDSGKMIIA